MVGRARRQHCLRSRKPGYCDPGSCFGQSGQASRGLQLPRLSCLDSWDICDDGGVRPFWRSDRLAKLPDWFRLAILAAPVWSAGMVCVVRDYSGLGRLPKSKSRATDGQPRASLLVILSELTYTTIALNA